MNRAVLLKFLVFFLLLLSVQTHAGNWNLSENLRLRITETVCFGGEPFPCQFNLILHKPAQILLRRSVNWPRERPLGKLTDHFSGSWATDVERDGAPYRVVVVIEGYLEVGRKELSDKMYSVLIYSSGSKELLKKVTWRAPFGRMVAMGSEVRLGNRTSTLQVEIFSELFYGGGSDPFPGTSGGT